MLSWIVTSSVLILVVVGLRFVLRGKISPQLQYALWLVVLFRLLVPFHFGETELSLMNIMEEVPVVQEMDSVRNMEDISQLKNGQVRIRYNTEQQPGVPVTEIVDMTEESYRQQKQTLNYHKITMGVWTAGMAVMFALFSITNLRFSFMLKKDRKPLQTDLSSLPVYVTGAAETPCLFGDLNPAIYVTPEVAEDETVLRHTIIHEMMHYQQHDLYWGFLRCVALSMHWYNPLVWWAAKLSKDDAELACDNAVIRKLGEEERYAYGKTLIEMTKSGRNNLMGMATTMTGSKSSLKERIEQIAKTPKMAVYTLIAVLVIAAVSGVCTMTGAKHNPLEEWLATVNTENVFVQIHYDYGSEASYYMPDEREEEELCRILNQIEKRAMHKEKQRGGITDYQMMIRMPGDDGTLSREYLFHVEDNTSVSLTFDKDTADVLMQDGKYWHIKSPELVAFIKGLVDQKGTSLLAAVEITRADVNHDGVQEMITAKEYLPEVFRLSVEEQDGTVIWEEELGLSHAGWGCVLLYHDENTEYLMRYSPYVNQGEAGYGCQIFYVKDGQKVLYDDDGAGFTYYSDEPFDTEVTAFLNQLNGYLGSSTILLSTLDGVPVVGPASTRELMDTNKELLNRRTEKGQPQVDILQIMESIKEKDITSMDYAGNVTEPALAKALNHAASSQITYDEAVSLGYDIWPSYYQLGWIHLESNMELKLLCGLTENIVEIRYGKPNLYFSAYFQNEDLYHLVRHFRDYEQVVDREEYVRFQAILDGQMEKCFEAMKTNPGMFYDYKLKRFNEIWSFEEEDGARVELYDFDYALLTERPDQIGWAGGMYLDSEGDVQGFNGGGQFAVRLRNGKPVAHFFLGNDLYYMPGENEVFIKETLLGMLNHSEENEGM